MFDSPPPQALRRHIGLISNALKLVDEARQQLTVDSASKGCTSALHTEKPASLHPVLEQLATLLHDLQARTADEQNRLEGIYDFEDDTDGSGIAEGGAEQLSRQQSGHQQHDDVDADYQDLHEKFIRVAAENRLLHQTNQQLWDTVAHLQQCLGASPYSSSSSREHPPVASTSGRSSSGSSSVSGRRWQPPAACISVCDSHFDYEEQIRRIEKVKDDARQSKRQHHKIVKGPEYKTSHAARVSYDHRAMVAARGSTAKLYNMRAAAEAAKSKHRQDSIAECEAGEETEEETVLATFPDDEALQLRLDELVLDNATAKDSLIKANEVLVQQKQDFDRLVAESAAAAADALERKKQYDHVVECAIVDKAVHDKLIVDSAALKGQFDALLVDNLTANEEAAQQKREFDRLMDDSARVKNDLAQAAANAVENKKQFDHVLESAAVDKACHDKLIVDSAALKGQFDFLVVEQASVNDALAKASVDAALQKQEFDQLIVDSAAAAANALQSKRQFDRVVESAAADKACHDKLILDSSADKALHDKLIADSAHLKEQFDTLVVEQAAALSDAFENKAMHDKLIVDSAALKGQFDHLMLEQASASNDSAHQRQEYDQLVLEVAAATADAVDNKRQYDHMLEAAAADKALHDELVMNSTADKAAHDKLIVDSAALKGHFDTLVVEQATLNSALSKASDDAALAKHEYDNLITESAVAVADAAEHKKQFDGLVESAAADKACHDKLIIDSAEQKATHDKLVVDSAEQKAQYDTLVIDNAAASADAIEHKRHLDVMAESAAADKAVHDKLVTEDAVVQKQQYDNMVVSAAADKAAHDKLIVDACANKALHDKLVVDSAALKGQFDTLVVDTAAAAADARASKADYDSVVSAAAAAKACHDKLVVDSAQDKASHDKLIMDSQSLKGRFDSLVVQNESVICALSKATEDAALQKEQFDSMAAESAAAAAKLVALQDEREALLQQQLVLKSELASMLKSYEPSVRIDTGTPAEKIMQIMTELVEGRLPGIEDILLVRSAILESRDLYQPMHLGRQLVGEGNYMDRDVTLSLMAQLGTQVDTAPGGMTLAEFCHSSNGSKKSKSVCSTWSNSSYRSMDYVASAFLTLGGALSAIMAPNGQDEQDLPSGPPGMLSRRGTMGRGDAYGQSGYGWDTDASRQFDYLADSMMPPPPILEDVERVLARVDDWQFDAFELQDVSQGHPLSTMGYYLFSKSGLIDKFGIKPTVLARALRSLEDGYSVTAPYHSSTHACDVLQSVHNIIHRGGLMPGYVDPLTLMACYLAAIMHDYEHEGLTNDFLINSGSSLAVLYNDKAPLENHHCAAAFSLLRQPGCDFMSHMVKADRDKLRKLVIDLILGTDMKQHFTILGQFKTLQRIGNLDSHVTPSIVSISDCNEAHDDCALDRKIVVPLDDAERVISLQMMLKCADLGHVASHLPVHLRWVACLEEEFFKQGDKEKRLGLPISPLFDRTKQGVSKSQIGFLDIVCIPLFQALTHVFPSARPMFGYLMHNYEHWMKVKSGEEAAK